MPRMCRALLPFPLGRVNRAELMHFAGFGEAVLIHHPDKPIIEILGTPMIYWSA